MGPRWRCSPTPSIAISTGKSFEAALAVLLAGGRRVHLPVPASGTRPLCCGRTFLAVGAVDEAKMECARLLEALSPFVARGVPILGLEPSCLYSLRDELPALMPSDATRALSARALMFDQYENCSLSLDHATERRILVQRQMRPE